jgi:hypothetical protein
MRLIQSIVCFAVIAAGKDCSGTVLYGYDQTGGKVLGGPFNTANDGECCKVCLTNFTNCDAWVRDPVKGHNGHCWAIAHPTGTIKNFGRDVGLLVALPTPPPTPPPPAPSPLPPLVTKLEAFGSNSIRVRVAVPGQSSVTEPAISALLASPPSSFDDTGTLSSPIQSDPLSLTNGNLKIVLDPVTYQLTATRVSDSKVLLKQTALLFTQACVGSKPGSKSITASFASTAGERVYGLGEHVTGKVMQASTSYYHF